MTVTGIAVIAAALDGGDFYDSAVGEHIEAFAWPLVLQAGGLATLSGTRLQPTSRGRAVMAAPDYPALGTLWSKWLTKAPIDEFSRIDAIKGQRKTATLTAATKRRSAVALGLADLPVGEWIEIDAVFRSLQRRRELQIARSERAVWNLYLEDPQYGSMGYDGFGTWDVLEGRYTLCVLFEYAATLGLLDVAYRDPEGARDDYQQCWGADDYGYLSRYDGLTAVRINPLGTAVLKGRPTTDLGLPAVPPVSSVGDGPAKKPALASTMTPQRAASRATRDRAIVAALADPVALQVFAAITGTTVHRPLTTAEIAETTGLSPDAVMAAADRLATAGLMLEDAAGPLGWRLNRDALTA